jgi:hypothetical protein
MATLPGILFAVLFTAGVLALGDLGGSFGDPDRQFVSHYSDASKRALDIAGGLLLAGSGFSFLVFVARLRDRSRMAGADATLTDQALAGAIVFVALLLAATAGLLTPAVAISLGNLFDEARPRLEGAEVAVVAQLGYVLLLSGMLAAAFTVATISLTALRSGVFGPRLVRFGFVTAALLVIAVASIPVFALPLWVLAVSLSRSPEDRREA